MTQQDDKFKEIRPYFDNEVSEVIARLTSDQALLTALAKFKFPKLYAALPPLAKFVVRKYLKGKFGSIDNVRDIQLEIEHYVFDNIKKTTTSFAVEGLDKLDPDMSYLFLSNHRDIVMDPTFVNYALHLSKFKTSRIAAGDNLLSEQYIEDLMRLNKTFIVKRSVTGKKEKLAALMLMSEYISTSVAQGNSIWIAHREGRSKDGTDLTDSAVLKMLQLGQRKQTKVFSEAVSNLRIVPVTLSYQYDPCDEMKAKELVEKAKTGSYQKAENEDTQSIVKGIMGFKGDVKVSFGQPLTPTSDDPAELAEQIDLIMRELYALHDSNYAAYVLLKERGVALPEIPVSDIDLSAAKSKLTERIAQLDEAQAQQLLQTYANAVLLKVANP